MSIINEWANSVSKMLNADYDMSSLANHKTIIWGSRESALIDILKKFLPRNIVIWKWEIIDSENNKSKQMDIIIYRSDFPVIDIWWESNIYLIEGVLATIEVKSTLNEVTLFDALNNWKSVKNLRPSILPASLDSYSQIIYKKDIANLSVVEMNSLMWIVLPSNYIFSYKWYKNDSVKELIQSINKWYNNPENDWELDPLLLPEVISTEGCVSVKNLNNLLGLPHIEDSELEKIISQLNKYTIEDITKDNINEYFGGNKNWEYNYSLWIQSTENPLQYLISDLLENILLKIGHQQLWKTNIQYNLLAYHIPMENKNEWRWAAINIGGYTDPRLSYIENLAQEMV